MSLEVLVSFFLENKKKTILFWSKRVTIVSSVSGHTQAIPAHKYVLATGSSVFYAMFYGGLAENTKDIEVPDVEPAAFLALLR